MAQRLTRLAEIFDRPQAAQRRIEERREVRQEHVVQKQLPDPVSIVLLQVRLLPTTDERCGFMLLSFGETDPGRKSKPGKSSGRFGAKPKAEIAA